MPQTVQHPPTPEEVRALLVAASELDPTLGAYVRFVAATGMRRAEACAVRWGDLDLQAKTLTVARSHVAVPGVREDKETKTRSTRTVILDDATVGVLAQLRESRVEIGTDPELPVFTDDGGTPWRPDGASARWPECARRRESTRRSGSTTSSTGRPTICSMPACRCRPSPPGSATPAA